LDEDRRKGEKSHLLMELLLDWLMDIIEYMVIHLKKLREMRD